MIVGIWGCDGTADVTVLKTVAERREGSNPSSPTTTKKEAKMKRSRHLYPCTIKAVETLQSLEGYDTTQIILEPDFENPIILEGVDVRTIFSRVVTSGGTPVAHLRRASLLAALGLTALRASEDGDLIAPSIPQSVVGSKVLAVVVEMKREFLSCHSFVYVNGFLPITYLDEPDEELPIEPHSKI